MKFLLDFVSINQENHNCHAEVVKLVDAGDSKSPDLRVMRVRFPPSVHSQNPFKLGVFYVKTVFTPFVISEV